MELLQWSRSEATTKAVTMRVTEVARKKRGNWYVKNIIKVKYAQVVITDWMLRMD